MTQEEKEVFKRELCALLHYEIEVKDISEIYVIDWRGTEHDPYKKVSLQEVVEQQVCKPILRPLSQLTEEITHNGETFVPVEKLYDLVNEGSASEGWLDYLSKFTIKDSDVSDMPKRLCELLREWHFWLGPQDFFEKGYIIEKIND